MYIHTYIHTVIHTYIHTNNLLFFASLAHCICLVPPVIIPTATTIVTPIYSTVWLDCNATGIPSPRIVWLKDALPLVADPYKFSVLANGSLRIHNATKTDVGNYQCVAINDGGRDNITIHLDVHGRVHCVHVCLWLIGFLSLGPPRLTSVPTNESLLIGSPLEWRCEATGNPKPSVAWMKNGQKLEADLDTVITSDGTRLTVTNVDLSHAGQYTCKANNSLGEDSTSVFLSVLGKTLIVQSLLRLLDNSTEVYDLA